MKTQLRDDKQYIILALNTVDDDFVWEHLDIKPLKELIGSYKGETERSYLLPYDPDSNELYELGSRFNQESLVVLGYMENGIRHAFIDKCDGNRETLSSGVWTNVGAIKPNCDAWTFDIESGDYFIIIE